MTSTSEIGRGEVTTKRASPAARCIQLRLLGNTFHPVYTHQLFDNETIRGYLPPDDVGDIGSDENEEVTTRDLTIRIDLAPSCDQCQVSFHTIRPKKRRLRSRVAQKSTKKAQADAVTGGNDENSTISNDESDKGVSEGPATDTSESSIYVDEEDTTTSTRDEEGNTRRRRMPLSEIEGHLSKALPKIVSNADPGLDQEYLKITPGTFIEEYDRNGARFCLTLANGPDLVEYHNEVQRLARFFIETADDVDVANQSDGGNWTILYLCQMHKARQYSLAGYFTLFHFNSPFRKPAPGIVVRICQALILPPYQRSGHGFMMMSAVYKWAFEGYSKQLQEEDATLPKSIVEINVEDPAPAFVALRNRVDYQRFLEAKADGEGWFGSAVDSFRHTDVSGSDFFTPLPDSILNAASAKAKITPRQVQVVYELLRLHQLQTYRDTADKSKTEALEKRYRLLVKKRLQREYREDIGACNNKVEMKLFLTKLYEQTRQQHETIIRSHCPS